MQTQVEPYRKGYNAGKVGRKKRSPYKGESAAAMWLKGYTDGERHRTKIVLKRATLARQSG
ncbi:MAG: hypothetical protein DRP42_04775 [Tenericutes bacterium]|nr:MAG: hypothetical protein DRP42_04775 [Mycoplasmatota bacterium]